MADAIYDCAPFVHLQIPNEIKSLADAEKVHDALIKYKVELCLHGTDTIPHYRGESNFGWDMTPSIFRGKGSKLSCREGKEMEEELIIKFRKEVSKVIGSNEFRDLFDNEKYGKKWDELFLAQHAGIRTSLLDFSISWERALFFAAEADSSYDEKDGQLWVYQLPINDLLGHETISGRDTYYDQDPKTIFPGKMIKVPVYLDDIEKRIFEGRMDRQVGSFYIPDSRICKSPLNHCQDITSWLYRFRIPAGSKSIIRKELQKQYGIDRMYLYVEENLAQTDLIKKINLEVCGW